MYIHTKAMQNIVFVRAFILR